MKEEYKNVSYMSSQDYIRTRLREACELKGKNTEICHVSFWLHGVPWYAGESLPWPRFQGFKHFSVFNKYCSRYMPVIDLADELQKVMIT